MQGTFQMKKLIYIVLVMTVITACSDQTQTNVDDTLPKYDVTPYCHKFSSQFKKYDIEGDNYSDEVFNDCLQEEKANYEWLKTNWDLLSSKSKVFCKQAVGNPYKHYRVLKECSLAGTCLDDRENLEICAERKKQEQK